MYFERSQAGWVQTLAHMGWGNFFINFICLYIYLSIYLSILLNSYISFYLSIYFQLGCKFTFKFKFKQLKTEDLIFYIWIELSRQFLFISIQYTFVPVYNHNAFNLSWFQTGSVWVTTLPPALNTLSLFVLEAGIARYFLASLASNGRESSWTNLFYSEWSTGCRDLRWTHKPFVLDCLVSNCFLHTLHLLKSLVSQMFSFSNL